MQAPLDPASRITRPVRAAAMMIAALFAAAAASADNDRRAAVPLLPKYASECASCHIAYPAGMLPAASWQRLLQDLPRHFGTDASVDAATARELTQWLTVHAGTSKRVREAPPQDRITQSDWFIRAHRELSPATWKLPAVQGPANCSACHADAEKGDFNEHRVRIPR